MIGRQHQTVIIIAIVVLGTSVVLGGDWQRFRGPNGNGNSSDDVALPVTWSDSQNLKWKVDLPGPGHSSPIVVGDRVFVTCWTGYGVDQEDPGDPANLKRHLLCIHRNNGQIIWDKSVAAELPEERYGGNFAEHGYATHTPVSDGERVFVFFGKSGVLAFDMDGHQLWQKSVGTELDRRRWGSASSPILYKNLVIVTASVESSSLVALDKDTGEEVWAAEADGFGSTWGTPIIHQVDEERSDIVLAVPYEIWAFNPENGKLRWYCEAISSNSMCSSVIAHDGVIYAMESGPGGGGSIAVRGDGTGDVTETHVLWTGQDRNRIGTAVHHDGRLYWVSGRIANCIDAKSGEEIYQTRLSGGSSSTSGEQRRGRRGGGQDYSSAVIADGKLYYVRRNGEAYVLKLGPEFNQLAVNSFESDDGEFTATPAISNGELFIRSTNRLYCVAQSASDDDAE